MIALIFPVTLLLGLLAYAWYQCVFVLCSFPRLRPPALSFPRGSRAGVRGDLQASFTSRPSPPSHAPIVAREQGCDEHEGG